MNMLQYLKSFAIIIAKRLLLNKGQVMKFLSLIYALLMKLRNYLYKKNILKSYKVEGVQVICIGNITVGGTGKTPAVQYFVNKLKKSGKSVGIVSRGYRGVRDIEPLIVHDGNEIKATAKESGDEAYLHALNLGVPIVVGKDRYAACLKLKENFDTDIIIMDDGFQHRRLERDKNIVLIDATNPFGGGYTLPYGRLREDLSELKRANELIITKSSLVNMKKIEEIKKELKKFNKNISVTNHSEAYLYDLNRDRLELDFIKRKKCLLFSGLAKPENFEKSVRKYEPSEVIRIDYEDHHNFTKKDYDEISRKIQEHNPDIVITTEKDLVKLNENLLPVNILILKIEFTFLEDNVCWDF